MFPKWIINVFMRIVTFIVELYTIITLPIYRIIQKPSKVLERSCETRAVQIDPSNPYSEYVRNDELPFHPLNDCSTIAEAIQQLALLYDTNRKCIGYREILEEQIQRDSSGKIMRLDGKVLKKYKLSDYKWITYNDVFVKTNRMGKGMFENGFKRNDKLLFFAETRMENFLFTATMARIGGVTVSVFANLDNDSIVYAINSNELTYCYTTYDLLERIVVILERCPKVKTIFFVEGPPGSEPIPEFPNHITLISLSKLESDGINTDKRYIFEPLTQDEIPFIMYTSGTTGAPKGIYATCRQMKNAGLAVLPIVKDYLAEAERHTSIAYLPQAHVLEASIEALAFLGGLKMGFATPFTLNESAPGLAKGVECDLKMLKPTVMAAVPLVLDRMRKEMYHKLRNRTPFSTALFDYLISYKIKWTQKGYNTPIVNFLLCRKVQEQFGGRLEHMVVGSAPLSPDLQALIKASLNVNIGQGYGTTETLGAATCMDDHDLSYGRVGAPLWGVRIKLRDWEEGGYTVRDKPNPRGEIIVGGDGISKGYYKNEELNKECYFEENGHKYFYTGDIGEVFPDGTFKIIDRIKDLIKLANGEFVSLGKIESTLKNCEYIDNICVIGNGLKDFLVALVVPHVENFNSLIKSLNLDNCSFEKQCNNPEVNDAIYYSIVDTGKTMNLNRREIPSVIKICTEIWSPDNDMLTATMKLKRSIIQKYYDSTINAMFNEVNVRNKYVFI